MRQVCLGSTGLEVSAIAFGTWAFGGDWGTVDIEESTAVIHKALDLGITLFDTAQGYGFGAAERLLGDALRQRVKREDVVIATKGGLRMDGDALVRDAGATWLREGVESSLRSLGTDHIDLFQIHWPDPNTPAEETAQALERLVGEGKIRYVGVSNYGVEEMEELRTLGRLETLQPPYHMFHRDIETEILPYTAKHDLGVLVYGPLAHGLLGGRMSPATTFAADDWRGKSLDFTGETFLRNLRVVDRLKEFAADRGITLPTLAAGWTLAHPAIDVTIVGARRPSQLNYTAAADLPLSEQDLAEIDLILADSVPMWGPHPEGM
ncbi:aldo/keto reductase [Amycolatopsis acidiphila]|uniref:Aldo/keto reductase n=1 Tax=Amycolatopsis acidiphila TaxID=715473 RepID=A0A558ALA5_9PSEU|nr:aldo/keto reductase [Amycolatopsis acidiphila]TVT25045.1 aldo/keto reductase [Amycolatopsis acidiphila]UIJ57445.1 aldo/keto reductase [Amycolatopsis acidiphila]GHG84176.1 general stress protein 69 [Amycolatopsis acidiphila]